MKIPAAAATARCTPGIEVGGGGGSRVFRRWSNRMNLHSPARASASHIRFCLRLRLCELGAGVASGADAYGCRRINRVSAVASPKRLSARESAAGGPDCACIASHWQLPGVPATGTSLPAARKNSPACGTINFSPVNWCSSSNGAAWSPARRANRSDPAPR